MEKLVPALPCYDPVDKAAVKDYDAVLVGLAQLAEKAERYDDMCYFLTKLVDSKHQSGMLFEEPERNLLSVAFKNVVGVLRSTWRTFQNSDVDVFDADCKARYEVRVELELEEKCKEVIDLLEKKLIPKTKNQGDESEVFYLKMAGDYYRYLAEFKDEKDAPEKKEEPAVAEAKKTYGELAGENYRQAYDVAKKCLAETHPTRLGLALNYSVCHYEILKQPRKACELAKSAFDKAIQKLDTLNDANYKDSTLIMQLLRDNLTLWNAESSNKDTPPED